MPGGPYQDAVGIGIIAPPTRFISAVETLTLQDFVNTQVVVKLVISVFDPIAVDAASIGNVFVQPPVVAFAWNANTEADLAGYKLYVGRNPGSYLVPGSPIDVGNVLTTTYAITAPGAWFFALTAYNASQIQSGFSTPELTRVF